MGVLAVAGLASLGLGLAAAKPVSFASVPTATEVGVGNLGKLTECLGECAFNPAHVLAPFSGCSFGEKVDKDGSCQIRKSCFEACYNGMEDGAVITQRYNIERTSFVVESTFTPANVNSKDFGIEGSWNVDGSVYAQPLYIPRVRFAKGVYKDLVIIATEFNSVYGFDADTREQLWKTSLTIGRVVDQNDFPLVPTRPQGPCNDIAPYYGITSTPAIDLKTFTVYAMSYSVEGADVVATTQFRLNALDFRTGAHKKDSPSVPVAGSRLFPDSNYPNNATVFRAIKQLQRPGLALYKGSIYASFGSHCDRPEYWPWIFAFEPSTLAVKSFWTTPSFISRTGGRADRGPVYAGGPTIWMGGTAPSFIGDHIYVVTGRGPVDPPKQGFGNSILKLDLALNGVQDFFTPANAVYLDDQDQDLGSSGAIVVKDLIVTGGKQGPIYLAKADNLGGYQPNANNTNVFQVLNPQPLTTSPAVPTIYSGPAYWPFENGQLYTRGRRTSPTGATLFRYSFGADGKVIAAATAQAKDKIGRFDMRASNPVIQAASADAKEAILWEIDENSSLFAWNALDLTNLFQSNNTQVCGGTASSSGGVVKFALPTITSGKLYMGCGNKVLEYGLRTKH